MQSGDRLHVVPLKKTGEMIRTTRLSLIGLLLLLGPVRSFAQEIGFTASVDRNAIAVGEYVKLTVLLSNSQGQYEAPSFGGMVVAQGPFENSSFN